MLTELTRKKQAPEAPAQCSTGPWGAQLHTPLSPPPNPFDVNLDSLCTGSQGQKEGGQSLLEERSQLLGTALPRGAWFLIHGLFTLAPAT